MTPNSFVLAKIGTSDAIDIRDSLEILKSEFSFGKIGRAPARFDEDELLGLNARLLHDMPYANVKDRLEALGIGGGIGGGEALWTLVRANIEKLPDMALWSDIVTGDMAGQITEEDAAFCAQAAESLPDTLTTDTWGEWTSTLKEATGRKGKTLFMPLRLALTGQSRGPDMGAMLVLLGAEKARARLHGNEG